MKTRKDGFILFYTLILLMVVGILLVAVNNSALSSQRYLAHFFEQEQKLLIKYSIQKTNIPANTNIKLQNSFGKTFNLQDFY